MASVRNEKPRLMWRPKNGDPTNMDAFRNQVNQNYGLNLGEFLSFKTAVKINIREFNLDSSKF